jgi:hypothetical protein
VQLRPGGEQGTARDLPNRPVGWTRGDVELHHTAVGLPGAGMAGPCAGSLLHCRGFLLPRTVIWLGDRRLGLAESVAGLGATAAWVPQMRGELDCATPGLLETGLSLDLTAAGLPAMGVGEQDGPEARPSGWFPDLRPDELLRKSSELGLA